MTDQLASPWDDVETRRQAAIRSYGVLDDHHPSRPDIRSLVALAAASSGVPMAAINLLTENHQHQIEAVGFAGSVSDRADSMCAVVVDDAEPVVLADARDDERFRSNPWVAGPASVRFYATFQLHTPAKVAIGSLCLFDTVPRTLDHGHQEVLTLLAARVTDVLELELRNRQWRAAARELETVNSRLADFAATVSHDLRGPLGTVQFAIGLLQEREPDDGASTASTGTGTTTRDILDSAHRSTVRMAATIDHLLETSSSATTHELRRAPWRQVASDAVEDLGHEMAGLDVTIDPSEARVWCRPVGLRLVLQNLLSNAARYAGPTDARIEVACRLAGDRTEILVVDHGPGVAAAEQERIFVAGQRGATSPGGHGIGLATCRRLVSEMGGHLEVRETDGGGATFVVSLPHA